MNMKAKLYIDSEKSIIKVEGDPSEALHLLVCAIAQTLEGLFPHSLEERMAWLTAPTPAPKSRSTGRTGGAHEHDCICLRLP